MPTSSPPCVWLTAYTGEQLDALRERLAGQSVITVLCGSNLAPADQALLLQALPDRDAPQGSPGQAASRLG